MKDKTPLNQQLEQTVADLSNGTPTAAGQTSSKAPAKPEVVDAINQMFAEFELVYHNQYNKAYNTPEKLHYAKKLWYSNLAGYSSDAILAAVKRATTESEFLPSVRSILKYCETDLAKLGLPTPRDAYIEACRASSPKAGFNWSHAAVYLAGKASDWFFLANSTERVVLPVFQQHYQHFCQQVANGEELAVPAPAQLEQQKTEPLTKDKQKEKMAALRQQLNL